MELVFTFGNTLDAIRAETALQAAGVSVQIMPLPPAIKAGCGICLRFAPAQKQQADLILQGQQIHPAGVYCRQRIKGESHYIIYKEA